MYIYYALKVREQMLLQVHTWINTATSHCISKFTPNECTCHFLSNCIPNYSTFSHCALQCNLHRCT